MNNKRIKTLDSLRGIAIIMMIVYHLIYDLIVIYNLDIGLSLDRLYPFQQLIGWTFIIVSGVSSNLSRSSVKAGVKILAVALLLTLGTTIFMYNQRILFGVLHMLGVSSIIIGLISRDDEELSFLKGTVLIMLFLFFWKFDIKNMPYIGSLAKYNIYPLGLPNNGFYSSDYYPLIPWFLLYAGSHYWGKVLLSKNVFTKYDIDIPFVSTIGKNSLIIYILHQPIILLVLRIIYMI